MPRSVVAVVCAPSVIVSSATDPPPLPLPRSSLMIVALGEPWTKTMTACPRRASRTSTASRRLLRARRPCSSPSSSCCPPPPETPIPKSVEDDLQEIACLPPASTLVSSSSSVATPLPLSPSLSSRPMNNAPMSIAGIDVVVVSGRRRRGAVFATIKQRMILSARRRRESSRWRRGLAPLHPLHSFSSVAADATADAVP